MGKDVVRHQKLGFTVGCLDLCRYFLVEEVDDCLHPCRNGFRRNRAGGINPEHLGTELLKFFQQSAVVTADLHHEIPPL